MGEKYKMTLDRYFLEKGLQRLGIRELEERLEVSSLVFGGVDAAGFQPDQGLFHCGTYKEDPLEIDNLPVPRPWV